MSGYGENMNSYNAEEQRAKSASEMRAGIVVRASGLQKNFQTADGELRVLTGVDLEVKAGDVVSIVGESGAGKSTLLHILGGLDACTSGELDVCGAKYSDMNDEQLAGFRNENIGFVFQFHHLMADFTAVENVMMPLLIRGNNPKESHKKALETLNKVGLADRASHRPGKLSGGEQQRVAVARALVTEPQLILADEPSGNLDTKTAAALHDTLLELNRNSGVTFIIATHNREFAAKADQAWELSNGRAIPADVGEL